MQDESLTPPAGEEPPVRHVPPRRLRQRRATRTLAIIGGSLAAIVVLLVIAVFLITNTDWGRERVRTFLVAQIQKEATGGKVHVGRITGNLLEGMTVHDLVITDSAGAPFLAVDSARAGYALRSLWRRQIDLDDVFLYRPTVVLDKQPEGEWNWKRIFPGDTLPAREDTTPGFGDFLRMTDVTILDGHVIARSPWRPSRSLRGAQRDSAIRSVLAGGSRLMVVRVPGGFQKVVELREIDARMPLVQLADPALAARRIDVASMTTRAFPFRPPAAEIENLRGTFSFTGDSLWWRGIAVEMPGSALTGDGMYVLDNGDMWVRAHARPLQHADFRWLYPRLPSRGGGPLDLDLTWKGATQSYSIRNADLRLDRQRVRGGIAIELDEDVTIRNSDLRFANLDTRTIEQVVGGIDIPRRGRLDGRAKLRGTQAAMQVDADVAFHDAGGTGTSRVALIGQVGYEDRGRTWILRARNLRTRLLPLRLELAQAFAPSLPVGGTLRGDAVLNGASNTGVTVRGSLTHQEDGNVSRASGTATVRVAGETFIDADVRLDPLAMPTVAKFADALPVGGSIRGPVRFRGTMDDFRVSGDITHTEGANVSRVAGAATVRRGRETFVDADVRLDGFDLPVVTAFAPDLKLEGSVSGPLQFRGTLDQFRVSGDVTHQNGGEVSHVAGGATVRRGAETFIDADVRLDPLWLSAVASFAPEAGLRGAISGPLRFRGTPKDFAVRGNLALAGGGRIEGSGRVRPAGGETIYDFAVTTAAFDPSAISTKAPQTNLNGRIVAEGAGFDPATMRATVALNLDASSFEGAALDSAVGRLRIADGLAAVERLQVRGEGLVADARGSFGLRRGRSGELAFTVQAPSIAPFGRFIPGSAEGEVAPRPGVLSRRVRAARADSARIARATEVERAISGQPVPRAVVDTPRAIPRSAVRGSLFAAGTVVGNIHDFDARGRVAGEDLVIRGNSAQRLRGEFAWTNVRTPGSQLSASVNGRGLSVAGFSLDSAEAHVGYAAPNGRVAVALWQGPQNDYTMRGDFTLRPGANALVARDVALRFDTTLYTSPQPFAVRWGGRGVEVDNLELVNDNGGRVFADGRLPVEGSADLKVAVTNFQVGDVLDLLQSNLQLHGLLTAEGTVRGTMASPSFQGAAGLTTASLNETPLPDLRGRFAYADRVLTSNVEAVEPTGYVVAKGRAVVPVNLALSGVTGDRFPGEGLQVELAADSLPLSFIGEATDLVSNTSGTAAARLSLSGSIARPRIVGAVALQDAAAKIEPLGVDISDIRGIVRMAGDTVVIDSLVGRSRGQILVRGGLGIGNWREPAFDLYLVADDAKVLDNDTGELYVSAGLALRGPWSAPYLSGQATVEEGVLHAPSGPQKRLVSAGDPAIFAVLDTAVMEDRELLPGQGTSLLRNLRADVDFVVNRNTWVRSRELNVEIYTDTPVSAHVENETVALTGILSTDRGEYELLSKRFEVSSGSALFIGLPDINPTVQLTAQYEVRLPSRPAINIKIIVGGTMKAPRITLESDAQPPLSQTDLLSLVAFGTESSSLVAIAGSALTAGSAGNPFTTGLAATRLAAVALGMAVEEAESEASKSLGVDVFNIRPADVPFFQGKRRIEDFILGTEFEAGKYIDPQTFIAVEGVLPVRRTAAPPGARIEHRTGKGFRLEMFYRPRFLLRDPTLREQDRTPVTGVGSFGTLLVREWRF